MTQRVPCLVPGCRRTYAPRSEEAGDEVICGKHYRLADKSLLTRNRKWRRVLARENAPTTRALRVHDLLMRVWDRIKRQAIERAGGLS